MQRLEDIRDFFGKPKAATSNEEAGSSKSKSKKMKRVIMLDSDDENEDDINPAPKKQHQESKVVGTKSKDPPPKSIKLTTADDFFGSTTVQQASKPIDEFKKSSKSSTKKPVVSVSNDSEANKSVEKGPSPSKKKATPVKSNSLPPDAEVHSNAKFKEALAQLDNDPLLSLKYEEAQVDQIAAKRAKISKEAPVEKVGENKSPPTASNSNRASNSEVTPKKNEKAEESKTKTPADEKKTKTPQASRSVKNEDTNNSEKKLTSSRSAYWSYQNRAGPQSLGAKEFPRGPDDCLSGKSFVLTGIMESFERDDVKSFIERHGGKVVTTVSSKTSYIVIGREPGDSKVSKAEKCGTEKLNEDQLLELVSRHDKDEQTNVEKFNDKDDGTKTKSAPEKLKPIDKDKKNASTDKKSTAKDKSSPESKVSKVSPKKHTEKLESIESTTASTVDRKYDNSTAKKSQASQQKPNSGNDSKSCSTSSIAPADVNKSSHDPKDSLLWVDKYQAKSMKQIIGQQGDKSNAKKLFYWLQNWHAMFTHKSYRGVPGNKENGLIYRAALLSGVAGIGKTTTATIVCKELGFEMISMNASDTRSQKLLNNVVAETLKSGTLTSLMTSSKESSSDVTKSSEAELKHVLIMDEVDGMAGNEDRGGMGELIGLIKKSKIPVICICNDRQHQKVRSLANYCLDLRFQRPRIEQLKSAMMSMCFKEGLKINPNALEQMIIGANQDVRQVIHHLQAWFCMQKPLTYDMAKEKATAAKKDQKMGPFDACRAAFCFGEERRKMTIGNKLDLFFYDYSMMPLFMQENYLQTSMNRGNNKATLAAISKSADSLTYGDLASKIIRSTNNWSLLPKVGMYTCVIPGELCQGGMGQFVAFPQWLGQNSKRSKNDRLLQDLQVHTRLHFNSSKQDLNMQIMPVLRKRFVDCLHSKEENGIEMGVNSLIDMDLTRDDLDTIFFMSQMTDSEDPWKLVSTKNKSAFTRLYNKLSYKSANANSVPKKKKLGETDDTGLLGGENEEANPSNKDAENDEDDDFIPGLISKKVPKKAAGSSNSGKGKAANASTSKASGKGTGAKKKGTTKKGSK